MTIDWVIVKHIGLEIDEAAEHKLSVHVLFSLFLPPVGVISTEVTYVLGGLVFAWIVEEWVWDYAITVTLLHVAMTVAGKHTHTNTDTHKVDQ